MRQIHTRLARLEAAAAKQTTASRDGNNTLFGLIGAAMLANQPELAFIQPADTDEVTMNAVWATLAWARRDFPEAQRLDALAPREPDRYDDPVREEAGDKIRAFSRLMNEVTPQRQHRQETMETALSKGRTRMAAAGVETRRPRPVWSSSSTAAAESRLD